MSSEKDLFICKKHGHLYCNFHRFNKRTQYKTIHCVYKQKKRNQTHLAIFQYHFIRGWSFILFKNYIYHWSSDSDIQFESWNFRLNGLKIGYNFLRGGVTNRFFIKSRTLSTLTSFIGSFPCEKLQRRDGSSLKLRNWTISSGLAKCPTK